MGLEEGRQMACVECKGKAVLQEGRLALHLCKMLTTGSEEHTHPQETGLYFPDNQGSKQLVRGF